MTNIEMLGKLGDPLERAIVRESGDELSGILPPYSDIWKDYVCPNRLGTGETLKPEWTLFGGSHYTALIRAHNALGFHKEIISLCERGGSEDDGALLLRLQSATSGFWWSLGALVDNLGQAIEQFPGSTIEKGRDGGANRLKTEKPYLKYLYQRRTQLIHSRVVPIAIDTGFATFDYGYLDGTRREALPASTEWKSEFHTRDELSEFYTAKWLETKTELASAWHSVRRILDGFAAKKGIRFSSLKFVLPANITTVMTACSACPPETPSASGKGNTKIFLDPELRW
ncbi:MAG: hypothetical protein ABSH35_18445 [Isosphaeraceae bacterium]|jgi:hypothetical protein